MVDRYTKLVLTVIAICLVWICARDVPIVREAQAQTGTRSVQVTNWPSTVYVASRNTLRVNLERIGGEPLGTDSEAPPLPVKMR